MPQNVLGLRPEDRISYGGKGYCSYLTEADAELVKAAGTWWRGWPVERDAAAAASAILTVGFVFGVDGPRATLFALRPHRAVAGADTVFGAGMPARLCGGRRVRGHTLCLSLSVSLVV